MELLAILVVLLGFWALGEAFWPGILERPPGGKVLFEWVLLPLLILLFCLWAFPGGDPQTYAIAIAIVGSLALIFAVP